MAAWGIGAYAAGIVSNLDTSLWMVRIAYFSSYGILLSLSLFTLYLIKNRKSYLYRKRKVIAVVGLIGSLFAFTPLVVPYVVTAGHGVDEGMGILKLPYLLVTLSFAVIPTYSLWHNISLKSTPPQVKAQFRLMLFGIILSSVVGFLLNAIAPLVTQSYATAPLGPASVVFVAIFVAIAMVKHRMFDIRLVVARSMAYVLSLAILALAYIATMFGLTGVFFDGEQPTVQLQTVYIVLALILALTFYPLKRWFDVLTRKVFYRDSYDTQEVLNTVSTALVKTASLSEMSQVVLKDITTALKPIYAAIIIQSDAIPRDERVISVGRFNERYRDAALKTLEQSKSPMIVSDELERTSKLMRVLDESQIAIIARLRVSQEVVGYLILGYKKSGNIYSAQDVSLAKIIAGDLAIAIQNGLRFEEIQNFNETLQDKVDAATHRLQRANTRLKQLDATKDEFVSMASHQLRTPLTSVKGYLSMVLEGDAGKLNPAQEKLLKEAFTSSERMVRLIGDFLNVSRLRTGKFVIEKHEVNMADLVEAEVAQLASTAKTRELTLVYEKPADFPIIKIDKGKVQQVIMNLIDNAIFYSKPKGKITIELLKKQNEITLRVKDNGIGVPAQEKKRLFTKFYRASNARKQRPDGTGIGLFMAQKVVIAHGGSMIFESTEGKGSTFGFHLPITLSKEDEARAATVTERSIIE